MCDLVLALICECLLQVDQQSSGKTALQVASHQGHKDIVHLLLSSRANLEVKDEDGDTALHYSAFGWVFCHYVQNRMSLDLLLSEPYTELQLFLFLLRLGPKLVYFYESWSWSGVLIFL